MSRVLVLGASGFIGRHVTGALVGDGRFEIAGAGRSGAPPGFDRPWLRIDLAAPSSALADALAALDPATVVDCAGATLGTRHDLVAANVATVAGLLDALIATGYQGRLVHLGSAAEYGPGPEGVAVSEDAACHPVAPYGVTKLAATQLVTAARAAGQLDAVVLRVFNAVGPGGAEDSLAGRAARRLLAAKAAGVGRIELGPLGAVRDFVDVRDVGGAVVAACLASRFLEPVLNVGSGRGHPAGDLVAAIAREVGFRGEVHEGDVGSPRSTDVPWQVADISRATDRLGWRPLHDLASMARSVVGPMRDVAG